MKFVIFIFHLLIIINKIYSQHIRGQEDKNINIKIEPSKYNRLTLDDLDQVKMEILHDMNIHIKNIEDEMLENQRLSDKTASSWSQMGAPVYIPQPPIIQSYTIPSPHQIIYAQQPFNEPILSPINNNALLSNEQHFKQVDNERIETSLREANEMIKELKKINNKKGKINLK